MKLNYSKRTFSTFLLSFFVLVLTSSCTIYQNVPNDDGIYSDSDTNFSSGEKRTRVIEENSDEHREYEKNYFTKELESLEGIDDSDVLTDIDNYSSVNDSISDVTVNYTPQSWGHGEDDDIVVNINLNNDYRWGGGFWNYCDPYFGYGFYNPWFGQRNYWGWFYNRHRFRPYFYGGWGYGNGFVAYEYFRFRRSSGRYYAYNNMRYGRRGGTYSSRAAANTNSIYSRSRRVSSSNARVSSVYRRGSQTTRGRNSSTTRPTSRTRPTITRGNTSTNSSRGNTSTRSRNSRGSSRTNRSSSSRSRSSARSSSSRSRGSSTRSSSRSSSSRSSGSSRSSSSRRKG